jgi:putative ABC transport system permease protein
VGHVPWERSWGRGDRFRHAIGRLKPGVSIETAARELEQIGLQLAEEFPDTNAGWTATVDPLHEAMLGRVGPSLTVMLAAVALVFLIACVNVATLVLQRSAGRQRELALRAALGATRWRLARQSLVDHALLACLGTLAGGVLATFVVDTLLALAPPAIPRLDSVTIDLRVLGYLIVLALVTIVITGLLPALRSSRVDATADLRGGTGGSASRLRDRGFVIAEVSLVVILLAGAGLMTRTMLNLQRVDLGFDPARVVAVDLAVPIGRMTEGPPRVGARPAWDRLALFYADVLEQLQRLPGVRRASIVAAPSLVGRDAAWFARTGIVPPRSDGSPAWRPIQHRAITPGYFDVLRLPLIRGRAFNQDDHALEFLGSGTGRRQGVAIVNNVAARQFWPGEDPIGQPLTIEGDWRVDGRVVVGVAGDARDLAPDLGSAPVVYVPFAESPDFGATLLVRAAEGGPTAGAVRARLRSMEPLLMIGNVRPLAESYATALAPRRFITLVLTGFAGLGLVLAGVGLYGVVAMSVVQRTREFGIRIALGASCARISRMVLRETVMIVGIGAAIGSFPPFPFPHVAGCVLDLLTGPESPTRSDPTVRRRAGARPRMGVYLR